MKYVIVFTLVLLVAWRWRSARSDVAARKQPTDTPAAPTDVVACHHCGLHVPIADALQGNRGAYCSHAHRHLAEG
jgi:uncharacterized protein